jgi:hypothetical protein
MRFIVLGLAAATAIATVAWAQETRSQRARAEAYCNEEPAEAQLPVDPAKMTRSEMAAAASGSSTAPATGKQPAETTTLDPANMTRDELVAWHSRQLCDVVRRK